MDADLIERLAREAGINVSLYRMGAASLVFSGDEQAPVAGVARDQFERFAAAVAGECAKVCEAVNKRRQRENYGSDDERSAINECAAAIRAKFPPS